ncbi:HpcH/HpaI aldolase/citrate lyase family protein [Ilumatobacter sp.]|uniref:HpcH/HpaI aldolase/citrate lyase family protein n=1 Tax=Ilumatobacter sp. TaxID=1967498 RepID=UPI003C3F08E1
MTVARIPRLRRSELTTPGSNPAMIAKAVATDADVVIIDLEDAVAPDEKVAARSNVVHALLGSDWGRSARAYRINSVDTAWCHDDVIDVVSRAGAHLDVVVVPKVMAAREVWFVDDLLTQLELKLGLEPQRIGLEVLIEEAHALTAIDSIARSSPRVEALVLGVGDLAASLGMRLGHIGDVPDGAGDVWASARHRLIVAARAAGIEAIDGPFGDFRDDDGFGASASSFALVGGSGKWCIHPAQLEAANRIFAPSPAEVDEARAAVDAMNAAIDAGHGAASVGGKMIDAATARGFRHVLERAAACDGTSIVESET